MGKDYTILILGELLILALVVIVKLFFNYLNNRKIEKILKFFDKRQKSSDNLETIKNIIKDGGNNKNE